MLSLPHAPSLRQRPGFRIRGLATLCLAALGAPLASAATVWTGPTISFAKEAFADGTLSTNQDRITDNVWIARGSTQGLYNAAVESFYSSSTPSDTLWAVGTTVDLDGLSFDTWNNTFGLGGPFGGPPFAVGEDFVLHLVSDDIYLDLRLTGWGEGAAGGGSFSYLRSTVPEPGAALLLALVAALALRRRR